MAEYYPEIFITSLIISLLAGVIYMISSWSFKDKSGSMTSTVLGANDLMYNKDQKAAITSITEQKANKKLEEQSLDEPENKLV